MLVWIDGRFAGDTRECLPLSALSLQYGYGVFETMRLQDGALQYFDAHYERLLDGCKATLLQLPYSKEHLERSCLEVAQEHGMTQGVLKLSCFKNTGRDSVMISCRRNPYRKEDFLRGFGLKISRCRRNPHSRLVGVKNHNYLENYLERQEALKEGFDDALFFNVHEVVSECSASNIFFIKEEQIYTPGLQTGILPGIMRNWILKKAEEFGEPIKEGDFDCEFLRTLDGAFVSNSILGIMPVSRICGKRHEEEEDLRISLNVENTQKFLRTHRWYAACSRNPGCRTS